MPTKSLQFRIIHTHLDIESVDNFYVNQVGRAIARPSDIFLTAQEKGKIVGAVRHCVEEGHHMLRSMVIHSALQRKGIGRQLLCFFENYLKENKITATYCLPYAHLVDFYGHIGFRPQSETSAPEFLQKRIQDYRTKRPHQNFLIMRRLSPPD